ncbi:MAG: DUF3109 family protein [Paludibacteraceae bacterium]|nr:DUF3109 family protein [Paludibacteraceae bacterium]
MFVIQDTLVSLDVVEKEFCCNLDVCRGCCCVEGDAGAPVTDEELCVIEQLMPQLLPQMTPEARDVVAKQGLAYRDPSGEQVLSIVNDKDCIFARTDHRGWTYCLIEKLAEKCQLSTINYQFKKPLSCHLYPIRLTKVGDMTGVEYHRWDICHCGRVLGKKLHLPLYQFLREPLIRAFGQEWYYELCLTATEWKKQCQQPNNN